MDNINVNYNNHGEQVYTDKFLKSSFFFPVQMKVNLWVLEKRGGQNLLLLKLCWLLIFIRGENLCTLACARGQCYYISCNEWAMKKIVLKNTRIFVLDLWICNNKMKGVELLNVDMQI